MKVNGYEVKPMTAWLMQNGELAIITSLKEPESYLPIQGMVHIRSDGQPGVYYWPHDESEDKFDDQQFNLVKPYTGPDQRIVRFKPTGENK